MMMLCAAIGGPFATIAYVIALNSTTAASNPGVIVPIAALSSPSAPCSDESFSSSAWKRI